MAIGLLSYLTSVGELFNDKSGASHLLGPLVHAAAAPEGLIVVVSDGVSSNFMAQSVKVLDSRVVGVLVGNKEGALDVTPIGVLTASKDVIVEVNVVLVNGFSKFIHYFLLFKHQHGRHACRWNRVTL